MTSESFTTSPASDLSSDRDGGPGGPRQSTLDILHYFNEKDIITPVDRYASNDYVFECTQHDGRILKLDRTEMMNLREWYFHEYTPGAHAEVRSVAASIEKDQATVWTTVLMHNDNASGQAREKVSIFFWRLEEDEDGEVRWKWWKEYTSAGVVSFDQTSQAS